MDTIHGTGLMDNGFSTGYVLTQLEAVSGDKTHRVLTSPPLVTQPTHWAVVLTIKLVVVWYTLGDLNTSYRLFTNKDEIEVDYLIMGPGLGAESETQA